MTEEINSYEFQNNETSDSLTAVSGGGSSVSRYVAREQAFILCFERLFSACSIQETIENAQQSREFFTSDYALSILHGVEENRDALDGAISPLLAEKWSISRISRVSLCLLRIAVYEILFVDSVPLSVAINEAVELAKKYSSEKDAVFINGVLGSFARSLKNGED